MNILKCYMTNSTWYNGAGSSKKVGIVVHSTGVNNPSLKRYVQPSEGDENYDEIIKVLGKNTYKNDWNHSQRNAGVHAFIGKAATGEVMTVEVGPHELDAWGVGKGSKGSYNYHPNAHLQFEICEDALEDEKYFNAVMKEAQEYCAHLCKLYGWDEKVICSHKESYDRGYGGNHADCDHWLAKFGKDMDWFRSKVRALLIPCEFKLLDEVRIKDSTTTYYNGKDIPAWVYAATLYVRKINDEGTVVVSTQKTGAVTGTVWATDLVFAEMSTEEVMTPHTGGKPAMSENVAVEEVPKVEVEVLPEPEVEVAPKVEAKVEVEEKPEPAPQPEPEQNTKSTFAEFIRKFFTCIAKMFSKK